jgi:hypothetical protein
LGVFVLLSCLSLSSLQLHLQLLDYGTSGITLLHQTLNGIIAALLHLVHLRPDLADLLGILREPAFQALILVLGEGKVCFQILDEVILGIEFPSQSQDFRDERGMQRGREATRIEIDISAISRFLWRFLLVFGRERRRGGRWIPRRIISCGAR